MFLDELANFGPLLSLLCQQCLVELRVQRRIILRLENLALALVPGFFELSHLGCLIPVSLRVQLLHLFTY